MVKSNCVYDSLEKIYIATFQLEEIYTVHQILPSFITSPCNTQVDRSHSLPTRAEQEFNHSFCLKYSNPPIIFSSVSWGLRILDFELTLVYSLLLLFCRWV